MSVEKQFSFDVRYRNHRIGQGRIDLFVERSLIIELKTVEHILPIHKAQIISYLRATNQRLGLLLNFNVPVMKGGIHRIVQSSRNDDSTSLASWRLHK